MSSLLKEVQAGQEILITDHGRPVGRLVPVDVQELSLADRIAALERARWLEPWAGRQRRPVPPVLPVAEAAAQRYLREDRDL